MTSSLLPTPSAYIDRSDDADRKWVADAIALIEADSARSADTHLHRYPLPADWGIDLYLKDESVHPTGSLKHRLARSLILHALCSGWVYEGTTLVEASSGSTAVSEAYFARMLGLPFVAVVPASTSQDKIDLIHFLGGRCHLVDSPSTIYDESQRIASETGGHFLDQFTYAERATDWRGNNNIAESVFDQMRNERFPEPAWIVVGAGTGGTSATFGRYARYRRFSTQVCVVDPEGSAFYEAWRTDNLHVTARGSRIEGIGRPRVEPSFISSAVDRMIHIPDAASLAAMRHLARTIGRQPGPSTGTNFWGAMELVAEMRRTGQQGSIVTLICDSGDRYTQTYYDDSWVKAQEIDTEPYQEVLHHLVAYGDWP